MLGRVLVTLDVAIIGAGLSGLSAGVRLAHFGSKVAIFERHTVWGGLNSFYKKDGHHFDTGLHAVTNYPIHKRSPLVRVCRQLRLRLEDLELEPQRFSRIAFHRGEVKLDFENGLDRLTAEIGERFGAEVSGWARLCGDLAGYPDATAGGAPVSGRERLRTYIQDPLLAEMILCPLFYYGGAAEDDLEWDDLRILFNSVYAEGFARPRRGIRAILDLLVRRFEEAGGTLRRRAGVARLEVDAGKVARLVLDDGEVVEAKVVLSSAGLVETERLRSDRPATARQESIGTISFSEGIYLLDRPASEVGFSPSVLFYGDRAPIAWREPDQPLDLSSGVVCAPENYAHAEPLAQHALRVTHLARARFWMDAPEAEYQAAKAEWTRRALDAVTPFAPAAAAHVTYVDRFTPRTVKHYTGHLGGAIYGSPHKQRSGRTDLENLFLCGTDQGLLGIVGAMLSGLTIANRYCLGAEAAA
jgi:phytoene dehydrogenase-like protein